MVSHHSLTIGPLDLNVWQLFTTQWHLLPSWHAWFVLPGLSSINWFVTLCLLHPVCLIVEQRIFVQTISITHKVRIWLKFHMNNGSILYVYLSVCHLWHDLYCLESMGMRPCFVSIIQNRRLLNIFLITLLLSKL